MKNTINYRPFSSIAGTALAILLALCIQACESNLEDVAPQNLLESEETSDVLKNAEFIDGHYIVVLREDKVPWNRDVSESFDQRRNKAKALGYTILNDRGIPTQSLYSAYGFALSGFAAKLTPAQANALQADPRVAYIEKDQIVRLIEPLSRTSTTSTSSAT